MEEWIVQLLRNIAGLAYNYDPRADVRYASNVMIFIERNPDPDYFPGLNHDEIFRFITTTMTSHT